MSHIFRNSIWTSAATFVSVILLLPLPPPWLEGGKLNVAGKVSLRLFSDSDISSSHCSNNSNSTSSGNAISLPDLVLRTSVPFSSFLQSRGTGTPSSSSSSLTCDFEILTLYTRTTYASSFKERTNIMQLRFKKCRPYLYIRGLPQELHPRCIQVLPEIPFSDLEIGKQLPVIVTTRERKDVVLFEEWDPHGDARGP